MPSSDAGNSIKIIDFGLAEKFSKHQKTSSEAGGTPLFMAPEVLGGQQFDFRVDVYLAPKWAHY
jgi:serine/threonine protein kinase